VKKYDEKEWEDGRVVADMTGVGRMRRRRKSQQPQQQQKEPLVLTPNEKRQVFKGVLAASLVALLIFVVLIGLFIAIVAYVWMK
jgi:cell division septal protein FtsQ